MCNLESNQSNLDENCLMKTTSAVKMRPNKVKINSTNLESIICSSRMVIMIDYIKNRPRKVILDTNCDNSKFNLNKNKEHQLLSEIVFGNFSLSSKANGFKLHIIKNPSKMIVSKLFNTIFNSMYFDNNSLSRKVSPDSGNNQSSSLNSSHSSSASNFSSCHSLSSSVINNCHLSLTNHERAINSIHSVNSPKNGSYNNIGSSSTNINGLNKSNGGCFFNDNCDIYQKSSIMMSIIFTFSVPEENKAEFEEFIFHYYVLLESILNRISQLICDNSYNINNGSVISCWKRSKKWLLSLLPRHIANICSSNFHNPNVKTRNTYQNMFSVKILEILEYFDRQRRIQFLSQIITGILLTNLNSVFKFFNQPRKHHCDIFPYKQILQNLGFNTGNHSFNRIIVKGVKEQYQDQASSWKDKISSSLKYYKKILNNSPKDSRNSYSPVGVSPDSPIIGIQTHQSDMSLNPICKDVEILTDFIAYLIRPVSTIAYQLHILPIDFMVTEHKLIQLDNDRTFIDIPLLNDGLLMDKEILPQINEIFYPNKIIDHICTSITPLQGLLDHHSPNSKERFSDQLLAESRQSEVTYNDEIFHPEFLVIDTNKSTVKLGEHSIVPSNWVEKVLNDFASLTKVTGYCSFIGNLYLNAALSDFSSKAQAINELISEKQTENIDRWLLHKYGLFDSDLALVLSICN